MGNLKSIALSALIWSFVQQFGTQLVGFSISILLARILGPSEFGLIGMITILLTIGNLLIDNGMGSSLLRTKDPQQEDYSTVFWTNILFSILVYAVSYFLAPYVALFFEQPILTLIIRIYCLSFIISSFSIVQSTKLNKELKFKTQMLVNIPSLLLGGIIGIVLALNDFGVWSLVLMNLSRALIGTITLWIVSGWKPNLSVDLDRFKIHWDFGYKLTLSGLSNSLFNNSYHIVIGKFFSPAQLGFYTRANSFKQLPVDNITNAISKVSYPLLSSIQEDKYRMISIYKRIISQTLFWLMPIMLISIIMAEPLFRLLLTSKWLPAVPYFQILCLIGIFYPWRTDNLNLLKVIGKSTIYFKLGLVFNILTLCSIVFVAFGIKALVWAQLGAYLISLIINLKISSKFTGYSLSDHLIDNLSIFILSIASAAFAYLTYTLMIRSDFPDLYVVILLPSITFILHLTLAYIFKVQTLNEFRQLLFGRKNE